MKRKEIEGFLGMIVRVGVPHFAEDRLFYISGLAVEIDADELVIKMSDGGFKQITIEEIKEIRLDKKFNVGGAKISARWITKAGDRQ